MQIYLPIAELSVNAFLLLGLGGIVGVLSGMFGVGGGFLIVPALVLALGFSMPTAVGTSLVIIVVTTAGAFTERIGSTTVDWHIVLPFTAAAIAASFLGTRISERISPTALTRSFAVVLIAVAGFALTLALQKFISGT